MLPAPSLGDLTFEVDPRREWTPPHMDSAETRLWDSPRTVAYSAASSHRSVTYTKSGVRSPMDVRVPDSIRTPSQPQPAAVTIPIAPEAARNITPRRSSPMRVVICSEPSLSQMPSAPMAELPSVRGQTVSQVSPLGNTASSAGFSGRRGLAGQGGGMVSEPGTGVALADHMSAMSAHSHQSTQDPVDTYLSRYQVHQRIRDQFMVRQDEHQRTVQELGARIQAMTRIMSPSPGSREGEEEPASPSAAAAAAEPPASSAAGAVPTAAASTGPQPPATHLPDHPLGRNRFAPLPAALSPNNGRRPSSASEASSHGPGPGGLMRSGLTDTGECEPAVPLPPGPPGSVPQPHPNQGAYLALPDGSFAGSSPFRGAATHEGLLFERYNRRTQAADLPELQLRYLRPGTVAVREPRQLKTIPRQPGPPVRSLPNGIPASRLERLSARRRDRSPPRLYQQHLLLHQQQNHPELVLLTGAPVSPAAAAGMTAVGDGLRRSVSLLGPDPGPRGPPAGGGSPSARSRAAAAAAAPEGGTLAQYLAVATAATSGEPLLDENFYDVLQQHFRGALQQQTSQLRAQLNVNLPVVLRALNCVNVTEPPAPLGPQPQRQTR